jgi:hypothetical protein
MSRPNTCRKCGTEPTGVGVWGIAGVAYWWCTGCGRRWNAYHKGDPLHDRVEEYLTAVNDR